MGAAAAGAGVVAERYLLRRARARPDPARGEPLGDRPGPERRVRSFDGTELAVHVVGPEGPDPPGPTLVFVHGFSLDLTGWHYQWRWFSGRCPCVLYDQRGHGRSAAAPGGDYSFEALAQDLLAVLDAEVRGPAVLVGHSLGGMAVLSLAALRPEVFGSRVVGAVLASTAAGPVVREVLGGLAARVGRFVLPSPRLLRRAPQAVYRIRARALRGNRDLAFLAVSLTNFGPGAPPSVVEHVARVAARIPAEVWTALALALAELDLSHALERVTVPALVLVGDRDRLTPVSSAVALARRLPRARLVVLPGAGHCAMLERPGEWNRAVEEFLEEVGRG